MFPQKTKINPPVGVVGTGGKYNNRLNIKIISDGNTDGKKAIGMVAASFHFGGEKQSSVLRCLLVRCHTIIDCNDGGKKEDVCMANGERYSGQPGQQASPKKISPSSHWKAQYILRPHRRSCTQ